MGLVEDDVAPFIDLLEDLDARRKGLIRRDAHVEFGVGQLIAPRLLLALPWLARPLKVE